MAYTKSIPVIVQKVVDLLEANKVALGVADVYYGEQNLTPRTPALMVSGGRKSRTIDTTRKFRINLQVNVMVLHGKVQSAEVNTKAAEQLMEQIEDILHANQTMDGLVIHGYVSRTDPGVAAANGVLFRSTRLTWEGYSREGF